MAGLGDKGEKRIVSRNVTRIVASVIVVALLGSTASGLDIVRDGKAAATVVVADDAGNYQKWAAQWLQEYVKGASGVQLPIVAESKAASGTLISIGHTRMARKANITTTDLKYDGCKLLVRGSVLYLIGRDDIPMYDKRPAPRQSGAQGTIRAVTTFLEDIVGVRWFLPGPEGTLIPSSKDISVPDSYSRTFIPVVAACSSRLFRRPIANYASNCRNAINVRRYGGHSWYYHVSEKEYYDDHPEYFAMNANGQRPRTTRYSASGGATAGGHLCTSNREVWRIMADKIRAEFDKGYDMVQLGQTDGWKPCLCPECMKMDSHRSAATITREHPCEKIWLMHKWVIEECRKTHPDKKIMVMVYGPTAWPSKKFDCLPDNAVLQMAPVTPERLEAWRGKAKGGLVAFVYTYWFPACTNPTVFVPGVSPEWLQKTLRSYRDLGLIGIHANVRLNWGLGGPTYYIYGKLLGDPDADIEPLLHEFCMGVYGNAGPVMKRFFTLLHSRSTFTRELKQFPNSDHVEDAFLALYPPRIVQELDWLLSKAESKAESDRARGWLKHARDCFDGLKTVGDMFAAKRCFEFQSTREHLLQVKERVQAFEVWRERILSYEKAYTDLWFPAYHAMAGCLMSEADLHKYNEYYFSPRLVQQDLDAFRKGEKRVRGFGVGGLSGMIKVPITWDFDRIMANLGRPKKEKIIEVQNARQSPVLDGRIGAEEWNGTVAHALESYRAAGSKISDEAVTTVRLMYDGGNLFAAYECVEPNIGKMKLKKVGRDGRVYQNDEVELFLNPDERSDRKVMQFMASPIEDAFYDARKGYITDRLDPNYDAWEVTSWNPLWRYAFHVDAAGKKWTLEMAIPFKSIGVAPPTPGTVWRGNFARCRRAAGEQLSSWISGTFGSNPELFGEIAFDGSKPGAKKSVKPVKVAVEKPTTKEQLAGNFVNNGGFENVTDHGQAASWTIRLIPEPDAQASRRHCTPTSKKAHSGSASLKLDLSDVDYEKAPGLREIVFNQSIRRDTVEQLRGKQVVLSLWLHYDLLDEDISGPYPYVPGPYLIVRCWGAKGRVPDHLKAPHIILNREYLASKGYVSAAQASHRWIKVEQKGIIPPDTETMDIHGGFVGFVRKTGKQNMTSVYVDDIRLVVSGRDE